MEVLNFGNIVMGALVAVIVYFLKGVADTVHETQKDHEAFKLSTVRLMENHEGRLISLEDGH